MTPDRRYVRAAYLVLSVVLLLPLLRFYWPASDGLDVTGHPLGRDFINVWAGPQVAFGASPSTLLDLEAYHAAIGTLFGRPLPFHFWSYPPSVLPALWPLAQLPYFWALAVWTVGLFTIFAAVVLSQVPSSQRRWALLALVLAPACLINAIGGQNGFLTAALFIGGVLSIDRRPVLAGVLFGLLTFKPQLGLVLPFALLALGAWRVIGAAIVTAILLAAGSIAALGIEPWQQYLGATGTYQWQVLHDFHGFWTYMAASPLAGAQTFGASFGLAMSLQIVVAVSALIGACWAVRRTDDPVNRVAILVAATLLVTPYALSYDLTALAAVIVWKLAGAWRVDSRWEPVCLVAWLAPTLMMPLNMLGIGLAPLALIAFFVATLDMVRRQQAVPALPHAAPAT
ncbi:MAG: DUF2029 domain-containing protein [Alphaproteobacteria bacterium]|nr:DUF2029 domain-containing protein [Alphaproteobacteria bacterium]